MGGVAVSIWTVAVEHVELCCTTSSNAGYNADEAVSVSDVINFR